MKHLLYKTISACIFITLVHVYFCIGILQLFYNFTSNNIAYGKSQQVQGTFM